jgi:hypothetical protein
LRSERHVPSFYAPTPGVALSDTVQLTFDRFAVIKP